MLRFFFVGESGDFLGSSFRQSDNLRFKLLFIGYLCVEGVVDAGIFGPENNALSVMLWKYQSNLYILGTWNVTHCVTRVKKISLF